MRHVVLAALLLLQTQVGAQNLREPTFDIAAPDKTPVTNKTLWATYYHIWQATESPAGVALLDVSGEPISRTMSPNNWCMSAVEGTVRIKDATGSVKTFNYAGVGSKTQVDCAKVLGISPRKANWIKAAGRSRFREAHGPYGDGVASYILVPYRTIAVDKGHIPYGTVLYIPKARGVVVPLPNGENAAHDGYFFAADRGGAIKTNHIDVFIGTARQNPFPNFVKSSKTHTFDAFVVHDQGVIDRLRKAHSRESP